MSGTTTIAYLSSFHDSASSRSSSSSSSLAPSGHRAAMFRWAETEIHSWEWMMNVFLWVQKPESWHEKWQICDTCLPLWLSMDNLSLACRRSLMQAISRRIGYIYLSHFQVPQLHPDQVLDIPEVFKSILQIGDQMSCKLSISISQTISV